ncbi:hypothetical protein [Micromonospora ureilytica]|nr:hypothetical protein OHB55_25130 [Micromonospora ureilytica]
MIRKNSRWFGATLMAMVLTAAGLVATPSTASADFGDHCSANQPKS